MFCGSTLFLGKSNSTNITSLEAHVVNAGVLKTSRCKRWHHPHQSLPVKNSNMGLFSVAAAWDANDTSVYHVRLVVVWDQEIKVLTVKAMDKKIDFIGWTLKNDLHKYQIIDCNISNLTAI